VEVWVSESIGPAWQRVADDLKSKISSGEIQVGTPIPSTTKLTMQYGVSVSVVRQAVAYLRTEGVLIGHGGKAVYVKAKPQNIEAERVSVDDLREQVAELREEVRTLAEQADAGASLEGMASEIKEIRGIVNLLGVHLRNLYSRVGQPYPDNKAEPLKRRHSKSS
jgi:DNA-binding GntR family transcriptional regulator